MRRARPRPPPFRSVLVANRGEVAVRIIRTLRELGCGAVAVYSEADRDAPHVRMADAAYAIGPAAARDSYLDIGRVLAAARAGGAEAVHPGWGFLAENPAFAAAVAEAGMTFVGPPVAAMETMGHKTAARAAMRAAGVPTVPGSDGPVGSEAAAAAAAAAMGYPVMLKAAAGGGGKGMRLVAGPDELAGAFRSARSEAAGAFGDATVYLEKALVGPRHIEVQIIADAAGRCVALGERECSLQRRHQKVVEESPSPRVDAGLRARMAAVACAAAVAVDYRGVGTVEFLVDRGGDFYFLEMNTRLQVEHPVTEMCFGVDLVAEQLAVAAGRPLSAAARAGRSRGHAIEVRLYAEDPAQNFLPSPGTLAALALPAGPGIRVDCGVVAGQTITADYDPLIAKIVAWAPTRAHARTRMRRALEETLVTGIASNRGLLHALIDAPAFAAGAYDTGTVAAVMAAGPGPLSPERRQEAIVAAAVDRFREDALASRPVRPARPVRLVMGEGG